MRESPAAYPPTSARVAWIFFDWATQPFFTLVTTFIFAPFFAARIAATPADGQALWGYATGAAGLLIALGSPTLGAVADATGRRKPWIAGFGALLALGCAILWFAAPGERWAVPVALVGFAIATVGAEFATVFNNAMMPTLAPPERLGRLSGTGWAVGYLGGLLALAFTLAFLSAAPETGQTLAGLRPLFGLDPATGGGDRAVGPLSALWFVVFVAPMFWLCPDGRSSRLSLQKAARLGLATLGASIRALSPRQPLARFLLANMLYADGLATLFALGGIYAAGAFGWGTTQIGLFGIVLIVTGAIGAFVGGRLDEIIGPRRVIAIGVSLLLLAVIGILGTTRDTVLFLWPSAPPGAALFASGAEQCYLALGSLIGLVAGPVQAASRTMLARLSPPGQAGQSFGLFALSGKVTSFLGPTLAAIVTDIFDSQRAGLATLVLFFGAGLAVLLSAPAPVSGGSADSR